MENNTPCIAFTSAAGGSGCTASAMVFARILSSEYQKKVLFIGFDTIAKKNLPINHSGTDTHALDFLSKIIDENKINNDDYDSYLIKDSYGVYYLGDYREFYNPLSHLNFNQLDAVLNIFSAYEFFDYLIFDVPFSKAFECRYIFKAETIVINLGYLSFQKSMNTILAEYITSIVDKSVVKPELQFFEPLEDTESFRDLEIDMHGQFSGEIRELASRICRQY